MGRWVFLLLALGVLQAAAAQDAGVVVGFEDQDGSLRSAWLGRIGVSRQARLLKGGMWRWSAGEWRSFGAPDVPWRVGPGQRVRLAWIDDHLNSAELIEGPEGRSRVILGRVFSDWPPRTEVRLPDSAGLVERIAKRNPQLLSIDLDPVNWRLQWTGGGLAEWVNSGPAPGNWLLAPPVESKRSLWEDRLFQTAVADDSLAVGAGFSEAAEAAFIVGRDKIALRGWKAGTLTGDQTQVRCQPRRIVSVQWFASEVRRRADEAAKLGAPARRE